MVLEILVYDESRMEEIQPLGIRKYYGCGTTKYENRYYRFISLEKLLIDTVKLFKKKRCIKSKLIKMIVHGILYALECIHKHGLSHCDIKPNGIMLDANNRAYLIDYGMILRFMINGFRVNYPKEPGNWDKGTI